MRRQKAVCTRHSAWTGTYLVPGDDAAPEGDVGPALAGGGGALLVKVGDGGGGRDGVEGHVDDGGDAARGGGAGAGPEALPVCAAGLVEVDMGAVRAAVSGLCDGRHGVGQRTLPDQE